MTLINLLQRHLNLYHPPLEVPPSERERERERHVPPRQVPLLVTFDLESPEQGHLQFYLAPKVEE